MKLDATPLPTDWDNIFKLWEDVEQFALDHPGHTFICADDPGVNHSPPRVGRLGWSAFRERPADLAADAPWDEQAKQWTIHIGDMKATLYKHPYVDATSRAFEVGLTTAAGRQDMLANLQMRVGKKRWDLRFLDMARLIATWSKDPSTKVGCVIVGPDREIRSTGFNGFPRGIADTPVRYNNREQKYQLVSHAESNALIQAARIGVSVKGCTAYCTWPSCIRCSVSMIQVGVAELVYPASIEIPERWKADFDSSLALLKEAGVTVRSV
jgi:dCMP deaminase